VGYPGAVPECSRLLWLAKAIAAVVCLLFLTTLHPERRSAAPVLRSVVATPKVEEGASLTVQLGLGDPTCDARAPSPPAVGAELRVFEERQGSYVPAGHGLTDERGRVVLSELPRGSLLVLAELSGRARASSQLSLAEPARQLTMCLEPGRSLAVSVTDERRQPLAEATVLAQASDPLPRGALTDEKGQASLEGLGAPPFMVRIHARGFESYAGRTSGDRLEVTLTRLATLRVEVTTPNGQPALGARVALGGASLWPPRTVVLNEAGQATIQGLLAGTFDVRATLGTELGRTEKDVVIERGEDRRLSLVLEPARSVLVRVTDGEGEDAAGVAGAEVVVTDSGVSSFPLRGRSGADGTLRLGPLEPGPATVSASAEGFVGTMSLPLPEPAAGPIQVPLLRGGTLRGRVEDEAGHPIEGATIEVVGTDLRGQPLLLSSRAESRRRAHFAWALGFPGELMPMGELGVTRGPVPPIAQGLSQSYLLSSESLKNPPILTDRSAEASSWVSGEAGRFSAHPVTPGRVAVLARHPDYVEAQSAFVTLSPGMTSEVVVVLRGGGVLEGRVVDARDRPVGGAVIEVTAPESTLRRTVTAASDGTFVLAALPSQIELRVARPENPERWVYKRRLTVRPSGREEVELTLPEERGPVEVEIVDGRDEGLSGVEVELASLEVAVPLRQTRFTDERGRVSFDDAEGLRLSLRAEAPGYLPARMTLEGTRAELRVTLERGLALEGHVTTVRGRRAVPHARVTVRAGTMARATVCDEEGYFSLRGIAPGEVEFLVEAPELARLRTVRKLTASGDPDRPIDVGQLDLAEAGAVTGRVLDRDGQPVAGARVGPSSSGAPVPLGARPLGSVTTDRDGRFSLTELAEGEVVLTARAPGFVEGRSEPVRVVAGRTHEGLELVLERGRDADGRVRGTLALALVKQGAKLVVSEVVAGSTAESAGVMVGDRLVSIDGVVPEDLESAVRLLSGPEHSDLVLELEHQGVPKLLRITREPAR